MAARQVTHVRKDAAGRITAIGKPGEIWSPRLESDAIHDIESGTNTYHVSWLEKRTDVKVVNGPYRKYLRTDRDNTTRNNLDDLPAF